MIFAGRDEDKSQGAVCRGCCSDNDHKLAGLVVVAVVMAVGVGSWELEVEVREEEDGISEHKRMPFLYVHVTYYIYSCIIYGFWAGRAGGVGGKHISLSERSG